MSASMAKFIPINCGLPIRQDRSSLSKLELSEGSLSAIFWSPEISVKIMIRDVLGIRSLDEMIYSIYSENGNEGITREGFAYAVEGSAVFPNITELSSYGWRNLGHYAFISLTTCLNVLSNQVPTFESVDDSDAST
jgi:hypothetical protein